MEKSFIKKAAIRISKFDSFFKNIKNMKKKEKRNFALDDIGYSFEEIKDLVKDLKNKNFATYISSGNLTIQKM